MTNAELLTRLLKEEVIKMKLAKTLYPPRAEAGRAMPMMWATDRKPRRRLWAL